MFVSPRDHPINFLVSLLFCMLIGLGFNSAGNWKVTVFVCIPGQGSLHLVSIHAKVFSHSALMVHSGLQDGGVPMYPSRQTQAATSLRALQRALGPQGSLKQGSTGRRSVVAIGTKKEKKY